MCKSCLWTTCRSLVQVLFPLIYLFPFVEGRVSKEVVCCYVFITIGAIGASFFYVSIYGSMTLLAKLVPPEIQVCTEGFRYGVTLVASVILPIIKENSRFLKMRSVI